MPHKKKLSISKIPAAASTKIIGGIPSDEGRFDYAAALLLQGEQFCGGSLITPSTILTASHCLDLFEPDSVLLQCTDIDSREGCEEINVVVSLQHPDYDPFTLTNDVALLFLETPSTATPVSIPGVNFVVPEETQVTTIGWGATDPSGQIPSDILLEADMHTVDSQFCEDQYDRVISVQYTDYYNYYYPEYSFDSPYDSFEEVQGNITTIDDTMICALGDEKDACQGDSGGSLLLRCDATKEDIAIATVSFGIGCAYEGIPGVFGKTFTPQAFEFIVGTTALETGETPNIIESLDDFCLVGGTKAPTVAGDAPTPFPTFSEGNRDLWICDPGFYAAQDGCDCDCGIPDPDCATELDLVFGCETNACNADGTCSDTFPPTFAPSRSPTSSPTQAPSGSPTQAPSGSPTQAPSGSPTQAPSGSPTQAPSGSPTQAPSGSPTQAPSGSPTLLPTSSPTSAPSGSPTLAPTDSPTTPAPTSSPTFAPTGSPTTPAPTDSPTFAPTGSPIVDLGAGEGVVDAGLATFFIIGFVLFSVLSIVLGGWVYMLKKDKSAENAFAEKQDDTVDVKKDVL